MSGYDFVTNKENPHLGGNIWQGDPWTFAPSVWRYMIDRFAVRSVLDLGSGRGYSANWFYENGCRVVAMDGEPFNATTAFYPTVIHDLTKSPFYCPVDLVHCQEVAEHIEPRFVDNFISSLTNGSVVLMTHAIPGQDGHHHVNCQSAGYWIHLMELRNFHVMADDTARIRKLAEVDGAHHLSRSGLVFGTNVHT